MGRVYADSEELEGVYTTMFVAVAHRVDHHVRRPGGAAAAASAVGFRPPRPGAWAVSGVQASVRRRPTRGSSGPR